MVSTVVVGPSDLVARHDVNFLRHKLKILDRNRMNSSKDLNKNGSENGERVDGHVGHFDVFVRA